MYNAYSISTLKFEKKINIFQKFKKSEKIKKVEKLKKKSEKSKFS